MRVCICTQDCEFVENVVCIYDVMCMAFNYLLLLHQASTNVQCKQCWWQWSNLWLGVLILQFTYLFISYGVPCLHVLKAMSNGGWSPANAVGVLMYSILHLVLSYAWWSFHTHKNLLYPVSKACVVDVLKICLSGYKVSAMHVNFFCWKGEKVLKMACKMWCLTWLNLKCLSMIIVML